MIAMHPRVFRTLRNMLALILCLASVLVTGCGKSSGAGKLYRVKGKVLVANIPLTEGGVRFKPDPSKGNTTTVEPVAVIGTDGTYSLYTNGEAGAPAGWYKVSVSDDKAIDSSRPLVNKSPVPKRYWNPDTSGIAVEVGPATNNGAYDLVIAPK
jgi:hypothetical protein